MGNNMNDVKSEMILRLALAEQLEQDPDIIAFLPENNQQDKFVFSAAHEKNMKKIFRMARNARNRSVWRKQLLRAAACIFVVFGISTVTVLSVDAFRIPILSFFADVKEKATQYQITKKADNLLTEKFAEHEPSYVPNGFQVEYVNEKEDLFSILYANGANGLWYEVCYSNDQSTLSFDTEEAETQADIINGNQSIIVEKQGKIRITMYMNTAQVLLTGTIPLEEAKKVLQNIK